MPQGTLEMETGNAERMKERKYCQRTKVCTAMAFGVWRCRVLKG
jgi:hypothetical protein